MRVIPVPVRKDNYSYLLVDDTVNEAAAVDPYTPSKVKAAAEQLGVKVVAGITTHHHNDHSGGNEVRSCCYLSLEFQFDKNTSPRNLCVALPCKPLRNLV
jgi:hydroxyacylglutathione hydrolase